MDVKAVVAAILPTESQQKQANLAALVAQTEKSQHYHYLKEFRVEQCQQFKEHKCTQHRPYICFSWHFPNQRRRRPIRRKDGTFNYSPDIYCTKYDENSGICPDGEECPFLHRVSGDVERKYHLRYYKTCLCVHPTDARGHCSKNGPHCAFAHGPDDLRPPVFDIRDLQIQPGDNSPTSDQLLDTNRTNYVVEDPVWEDQIYVLANYKTELCKKPPRLCRQGYACPYYHNSKDKRRTPRTFKYRSTPCPGVKHGDEWGDPETCEQGDYCSYCHTRTEQQFHPEIYKSTKCNDMVQHGYCPRGPFCAFAHTEGEMKTDRESAMKAYGTTLATLVNSELDKTGSSQTSPPGGRIRRSSESILGGNGQQTGTRVNFSTTEEDLEGDEILESGGIAIPSGNHFTMVSASAPGMFGRMRKFSNGMGQSNGSPVTILRTPTTAASDNGLGSPSYSAVLKQRHLSGQKNIWGNGGGDPMRISPTGGENSMNVGSYPKAIGFEREMAQRHYSMSETQNPLHNSLDSFTDVTKIKANLYLQHDIGCSISAGATNSPGGNKTPSTPNNSCRSQSFSFTSPSAFFTPNATLDTGNLAGNLGSDLDEFSLHDISFDQQNDSRKNSFVSLNGKTVEFGTSAPVSIPTRATEAADLPMGNFVSPPAAAAKSFENGSVFRMSSDGGNSFSQSLFSDFMSSGPAETTTSATTTVGSPEAVNRQRQNSNKEADANIMKVCLEWKSHAEELAQKLNKSEEEKMIAVRQRDEALQQVLVLSYELARLQQLAATQYSTNMDRLNSAQIQQLSAQLKLLMERYNGESRRCGQQTGSEREPICGRCGRLVGVATTADGVQTAQVCPVCSPLATGNSARPTNGQQPVITANGKST